MSIHDRRSFLAYFSTLGLSSTLFPGVLWAKLEAAKSADGSSGGPDTQIKEASDVVITKAILRDAAAVAGLEFTDQQLDKMLAGMHQNLARYRELRKIPLENAVAPPLYFNPILPGTKIDRMKRPIRVSRRRKSNGRKTLRMLRFGR